MRPRHFIALSTLLASSLPAQNPPAALPVPSAPTRAVEPGLETAVDWKWWVVPSEGDNWGLPSEEVRPAVITSTPPPGSPGTPGPSPGAAPAAPAAPRPAEYEVQKGDALALIAKRFGMTTAQLKAHNGLTSDVIRIGQKLKLPTEEEVKAMAPPPPPPPAPEKGKEKK